MKQIPLLCHYLILLHEFLCHSSYTGEMVMLPLRLVGLVFNQTCQKPCGRSLSIQMEYTYYNLVLPS